MREGVLTARDTAAHKRCLSFGCHERRAFGSTCQPVKVERSTFTPSVSASSSVIRKWSWAKAL